MALDIFRFLWVDSSHYAIQSFIIWGFPGVEVPQNRWTIFFGTSKQKWMVWENLPHILWQLSFFLHVFSMKSDICGTWCTCVPGRPKGEAEVRDTADSSAGNSFLRSNPSRLLYRYIYIYVCIYIYIYP